eukprot:Clim_evm7s233 gene=Clim_evmTU7s233
MVFVLYPAVVASVSLAGMSAAQAVEDAASNEQETRSQIDALPDKDLSALLIDLLDQEKKSSVSEGDTSNGVRYDINLLYNADDMDDWTTVFKPVDMNQIGRLHDTDIIDECVGRSDVTMKIGIFNDSPFMIHPQSKNLWRELIPVTDSIPPNRYKEGCLEISSNFPRELWVFDADGNGYLWNNPITLKFVEENEYYIMIKMSEFDQFKPEFKPVFSLPSNSVALMHRFGLWTSLFLALIVSMFIA